MKFARAIGVLVAVMVVFSVGAMADATFDLSGTYTNGGTFSLSFSVPVYPTPSAYSVGEYFATTATGTDTENGVTTSFTSDIYFMTAAWGGGFSLDSWNVFGGQFYQGTEDAPYFVDITNLPIDVSATNGPGGYVATMSGTLDPPAALFLSTVPEPSSLLLVGSAFGLFGPLRRRYRSR